MNQVFSFSRARSLVWFVALWFAFVFEIETLAGYPVLSSTTPRGAQRGSEVKIKVAGDKLEDFQTLMFLSPGFTVKSVDKVEEKSVECTVVVAPETRTGNHLVVLSPKVAYHMVANSLWGIIPT